MLSIKDGFAQISNAESLIIHSLQSHVWSDAGFECRAIPHHARNSAGRSAVTFVLAAADATAKPTEVSKCVGRDLSMCFIQSGSVSL